MVHPLVDGAPGGHGEIEAPFPDRGVHRRQAVGVLRSVSRHPPVPAAACLAHRRGGPERREPFGVPQRGRHGVEGLGAHVVADPLVHAQPELWPPPPGSRRAASSDCAGFG